MFSIKKTFSRRIMIADEELGSIEFVRSERAKHIRVRILNTGLKVSLPNRATQEDALKFINSIRKKLILKQEKIEKGLEKSNILISENSQLQTLTFNVIVKQGERKNIFFSLKNGTLNIEFPIGTDCLDLNGFCPIAPNNWQKNMVLLFRM